MRLAPHRLMHVMVRVGNLTRSVVFYTEVMGMQVLRRVERPEQRYSLAFLGYADEASSTVIELTYNHGVDGYELGRGFGHFALAVDDCEKACAQVRALGGTVTRPAGPVKGGDEIIAFITDPDGYAIELIEQPRA